ncbi:MAG: calcium-binding protein [Methylococcales bacterium]
MAVEAGGALLVVDRNAGAGFNGALFRVDRVSGNRTLLSDFGAAVQGPLGLDPSGVAVEAGGALLVVDFNAGTGAKGALFRVDPAGGNRTLLSDFGDAGQGPLGLTPVGVATPRLDALCAGPPPAGAIVGANGADLFLAGTAGDDVIFGLGGNDIVCGGPGNDVINGGAGNDTVSGGDGNDILAGDAGNDSLDGDNGNDFVHGGSANDTVKGGDGGDVLILIDGVTANDTVEGGNGAICAGPIRAIPSATATPRRLSGNSDRSEGERAIEPDFSIVRGE